MKLSVTSLNILFAVGSFTALAAPITTAGALEMTTRSAHGDPVVLPRSPESLPLLRIAKPSGNRQNVVQNTLQTLNVQVNLLRLIVSLIKVICQLDNGLNIL
ncbi:hypothetical protein QBC40DRAFT_258349 [Triangularia verruculosa]|uniref:Uncharacterized protein n=1 Tax=Triangularia verruculosa TaxID=2587418 RepID=A0AAN6XE41_9PEZI|nr:hypothetical protein QBC40DRAFT_258349 [Triangularia verruculosa]